MRKSSSESSEEQLSVDDVVKSGPLNVIGLFSHEVIGCKTRVTFNNYSSLDSEDDFCTGS